MRAGVAAAQRVPATKDLPAVVPAMLVKPLAPQLDSSGEGLFGTVIPDNRCRPAPPGPVAPRPARPPLPSWARL